MKVLICILITFFAGGDLTPKDFFGESYIEAVSFVKKNEEYLKNYLKPLGIDPNIAIAVVFPEIIRYNRFRDFIETSTLELAYVSGGKDVADFSIGHFQMKPSFVEVIENEVLKNKHYQSLFSDVITYKANATVYEVRQERISRLKQFRWQVRYLACFITIAKDRFNEEIAKNPNELLLILSSAYNLGLLANYSDLVRISKLKTFPYGTHSLGRFSYYDVANFYYQNSNN